jgi:hypothetical protein
VKSRHWRNSALFALLLAAVVGSLFTYRSGAVVNSHHGPQPSNPDLAAEGSGVIMLTALGAVVMAVRLNELNPPETGIGRATARSASE